MLRLRLTLNQLKPDWVRKGKKKPLKPKGKKVGSPIEQTYHAKRLTAVKYQVYSLIYNSLTPILEDAYFVHLRFIFYYKTSIQGGLIAYQEKNSLIPK